jgi:hypothetical protein
MLEFLASKNPPRRLSHVHQVDHFRFCYCGISLDATAGLTKYPEGDCNIPCPGNLSETCGGNLITETSRRRQSIILLTTYNNTININAAAPPSSSVPLPSTLMSTSSIFGVSIPLTIIPSSTISLSTGVSSSSIAILSVGGPSLSGAPGVGGVPTSVGPVGSSHFFDPGTSSTTPPISLSSSPTPNSSAQRIPIVISSKYHALCLDSLSNGLIVAVWIDVCDVCEHGLVTMTTTITTLHCGGTHTPVPTIPMTTSTKACAICGEDGSRATVTITYPDTIAMASASRVASLPAATGLALAAGTIAGSGIGRNYGNTSLSTNGTANAGASGGASGKGTSGAGATPASVAGGVGGPTPARNGDAPFMTDSAAASGSFGGPFVNGGVGGVSTANAFALRLTETFMLESSNGAGAALFDMGGVVVAMFVAILLA